MSFKKFARWELNAIDLIIGRYIRTLPIRSMKATHKYPRS